ncbi:MAG: DegT/DnrJ/EryC1/StrS aminotransferase [Gemmatimonadetes bacterium]|jgi:pyridoxal phosphate-dependent aminotransferase EpsN|nr:DegT/DnrJ/EryC1/StrS aminotransferase [Gemmatimonadota bacterium]
MSRPRIYLSVPHMSGLEQSYVADAFASNWLTSLGPNLDGFEREMEARLGGGVHTLAVSSGTAALHLVLRAAGVTAGDRVAVSTLTFAGSVWPIMYLGAAPVFLDSEDQSGNLDPELVEEYLRDAARRGTLPRVLVAVHLYGQHGDIDRIARACAQHGVTLVEDAAESLGATYRGRQTATTAPYAILSFNGNKIITTTGGGMVVARDPEAIARMKKWANQSREPAVEYLHREMGYNYRMSNVLAGIGRGQLRVLDERVQARRAVAARYAEGLGSLPGVSLQPEAEWGSHSRWLSVVYLDPAEVEVPPSEVVMAMEAENIEARPVWRPMHIQPMFAEAERVGGSVAERLYTTGLCLPSSSSLSVEDQECVMEAFRAAMTAGARSR